jgi:hypothetical protein
VDPLSILFAANACVAAIKQGCKLYKDAKTSFMEIKKTVDEVASDVKAVRGFWAKLFGTTPTTSSKPCGMCHLRQVSLGLLLGLMPHDPRFAEILRKPL